MSAAKYWAMMMIGLFGFIFSGIDARPFQAAPIDDSQPTTKRVPIQSAINSEEKIFDAPLDEDVITEDDTLCLMRMDDYENYMERLLSNHKLSLQQRIRLMLRLSARTANDPVMKLCLRNKQPK